MTTGGHQDMATFFYGLFKHIFYSIISLELNNLKGAWYTVCILFYMLKKYMVILFCKVNTLELK